MICIDFTTCAFAGCSVGRATFAFVSALSNVFIFNYTPDLMHFHVVFATVVATFFGSFTPIKSYVTAWFSNSNATI